MWPCLYFFHMIVSSNLFQNSNLTLLNELVMFVRVSHNNLCRFSINYAFIIVQCILRLHRDDATLQYIPLHVKRRQPVACCWWGPKGIGRQFHFYLPVLTDETLSKTHTHTCTGVTPILIYTQTIKHTHTCHINPCLPFAFIPLTLLPLRVRGMPNCPALAPADVSVSQIKTPTGQIE